MAIQVKMAIKKNVPGNKACYCWDKDVLSIAVIDDWQEVIYGCYNDGAYNGLSIGIKRNGRDVGRSSFYYQVVASDIASSILDRLNGELTDAKHLAVLRMIRNGRPTVEQICRILENAKTN